MYAPEEHENQATLNQNEMYSANISDDEEIDVINADESRLIEQAEEVEEEEEHFQPEHVFMVTEVDEEVYDEEDDINYQQFVEEQYENNQQYDGILENPDLYSAHYMNMEDEYLMRPLDIFYSSFESPDAVARITAEERLNRFPEMRQVIALRRPKKVKTDKLAGGVRPSRCEKKLDPKSSPLAAILVANRVFPSVDDPVPIRNMSPGPEEAEFPNGDLRKFLVQPRLTTSKVIPPEEGQVRQIIRTNPPSVQEPKLAASNQNVTTLTPLPDRFFQRRLSITAEQAGFVSECLSCPTCHFMFRQKSLLETHKEKHATTGLLSVLGPRAGLICPVKHCELRSDCIATVIKHMRKAHSVTDMTFERIVFKDFNEFKHWRVELERLTMSKFCRSSGKQNTFSKSTYYQCHHSGRTSKAEFRENGRLRSRQSKKLGKTCTAFFHVRENEDGTVLLRGCTKHSGHGVDIRQLPLSEDIRMEIAQLLIDGMDEMSIVEKMHENADRADRRYYLQSYEVRNVAKKIERFKTEYKERLASGQPLPDLAEIIGGKKDRERATYPTGRAKLACLRFPVVEEAIEEPYIAYEDEEEEDEDDFYDNVAPDPDYEVVIEDGLFNVPVAPNVKVFTEKKSSVTFRQATADTETLKKMFSMPPKPRRKRANLTDSADQKKREEEEEEQVKRHVDAIKNTMRRNAPKKKAIDRDEQDEDFVDEEGVEVNESAAPTRFSSRIHQRKQRKEALLRIIVKDNEEEVEDNEIVDVGETNEPVLFEGSEFIGDDVGAQ